jgi:hypothetical protein
MAEDGFQTGTSSEEVEAYGGRRYTSRLRKETGQLQPFPAFVSQESGPGPMRWHTRLESHLSKSPVGLHGS